MHKILSLTAFVSSLVGIFFSSFAIIGLILGIIVVIRFRGKEKLFVGLAIVSIIVSLAVIIFLLSGILYFHKEKAEADNLKQSIAIENKGLTNAELDDVLAFIAFRLKSAGYSDFKMPFRDGKYLIKFNDYDKEKILELLESDAFEAKIGDEVVLSSAKDIVSVCRNIECAGIDPFRGCIQKDNNWLCYYRFTVQLSQNAADKIAKATMNLNTSEIDDSAFLSDSLKFLVDGTVIYGVSIGEDIRGKDLADIQISGSMNGPSKEEAAIRALDEMRNLQILFSIGRLPEEVILS